MLCATTIAALGRDQQRRLQLTQLIRALTGWCMTPLMAALGRGASVKTDEFEIQAATTDGVVQILKEIRRHGRR